MLKELVCKKEWSDSITLFGRVNWLNKYIRNRLKMTILSFDKMLLKYGYQNNNHLKVNYYIFIIFY